MCGGKMLKNMVPTVKFGRGSIMIWECFPVKGEGKISVIDSKINAQKYKQILQENLMSSVESLELPSDYIFLQDNDPKHTAKSTKWLSENNVNVLQWPSLSPDLNPIGNWKFKSEKEHQQTSIIWRQYARKNGTKIPTNSWKKLIENYRKRSMAVEGNKGFSTLILSIKWR